MKTLKPDIKGSKKNSDSVSYVWRIVALSIPMLLIAFMLTGVAFIKEKVHVKYHLSDSYRAGDVAVFVAMPFLNATVK